MLSCHDTPMLLTITTTHEPATDLGYLLHKHPDRVQSFELSFGKVHVLYPEANQHRCTMAMLLDVDPVGMVRGKSRDQSFLLDHYVNDRPYAATSFLSVAISQVLGTAMAGRCQSRPELVKTPIPLEATIEVLPVRGGEDFIHRLFGPLGYRVVAARHPLDEKFPEWRDSPYYLVTLSGVQTLSSLLAHLYVLIPVFDNQKHYYVGDDEVEKLLAKGQGWLAGHPEKEQITRRYLRHRTSLVRQALARLADEPMPDDAEPKSRDRDEELLEAPLSLNEERLGAVMAAVRSTEARSVVDLGCGEGKLLKELLDDRRIERIVGLDVSIRALEGAKRRLKLDRLPERQAERIKLIQGSLMYRDQRLEGFDAATVVEVIEHLDPPRLSAFERVLFAFARPKAIVLTTPNREYNIMWESLAAGQFRHGDHRFEWTRDEFQTWANRVALQYQYRVRFVPVGAEDASVGSPTQMGVFERD
jgi:3' terminal RNA ribose 2'-O-methyltransferase Hen1